MNPDYPSRFDTSNLTPDQKNLLNDFFRRRQIFDLYLKSNKIPLFTCPGCGYPTLKEKEAYEVCKVCAWEDDGQNDEEADEIWGGPNGDLSLTENRLNILSRLTDKASKAGKKLSEDPIYVYRALFENFYPSDLF